MQNRAMEADMIKSKKQVVIEKLCKRLCHRMKASGWAVVA